jgi:amidohydrolase
MTEELLNELREQYLDKAISHRRQFHQNPELSFLEFKTAEYIRAKLTELSIEYKELFTTGTVAHIGSGERCIALRADIDAIPISENTGLDYSSKNYNVMHACGHDMHTAALLTVCEYLKKHESELNCTVKLIFQPAEEEQPGGAIRMIAEGALENPVPEMIFAAHIFPEKEIGTICLSAGPVMASTNEIYVDVFGRGGHAAQPHLGGDAILASANIINYYQSVTTKFRNPVYPSVLSIAAIDGRSAVNAFPDMVRMKGVLRCYDEDLRAHLLALIQERTPKLAELYDCTAEVNIVHGYPAVMNSTRAVDFAEHCAKNVVGEENILPFEPKMWAEDFAHYAKIAQGALVFVGSASKGEESYPLHNARLNPDETAMLYISAFFIELCREF